MDILENLVQRVLLVQNGFIEIRQIAQEIFASHPPNESLNIAIALYASQHYQVRSLAAYLFGHLAAISGESLEFLHLRVSQDEDWRVQEILAQAFDQYCSILGYEQALPVTNAWLADSHPNVRRAVTEGLRIWTGRPFYREHPEIAVQMLSQLRADNSEYVRRSVGNALRDISKKHKQLVKAELQQWDTSSKEVQLTYKLANKFISKEATE